MILYFDITKVPRSTSREEWKNCWRRVRVLKKELLWANKGRIELLVEHKDIMPPKIKADLIDHLVNPPLLLGPYMDGRA